MRRRPQQSPAPATANPSPTGAEPVSTSWVGQQRPQRSPFVWLTLFLAIGYCSYGVYQYQFESLPEPLTADQAGKRGFSEFSALKHVEALTQLGPHSVGSDALHLALQGFSPPQYVLAEAEKIKKTAHWEVDVEVDSFHVESGANRMVGGLFKGRTLVYADLNHIVVRVLPKYAPESVDNAILVSSHIDTVFSTGGAGDCSSCVAVMLELARGVSQWAHGFKHAVIFLFNTGEEEGLNGAHSFITQHPWSTTIRLAVDLEAMGIGGKSGIFQADAWSIENFASVAKYPSGQIIGQDIFSSGAIKSATDFQVYKEVAGLPGLDFAYTDNTAVYHTKNDKIELHTLGSLQHLGENMLAFLLKIAASSHLPKTNAVVEENKSETAAIYFDILGSYMIVYRQRFANMLHNSVIAQSLLIWTTSLFMGGYPAAISLALSCLSIILMWIFAISFALLPAFIIPLISSSPVPYVANPWLVIGLFGAPALIGALSGQYLGYLGLHTYLSKVHAKKKQLSPDIQAGLVKLEAERWLYKSGSLQWLILLILGTYYKIGSTYLALAWLVPPAFAYGFLEATLTPARFPKPLRLATLLIGLAVPIVISSGGFIRLAGMVIGTVVRLDRNPGGTPEWLANVIVAVFVAVVVCLTLVYLLSYIHLSGANRSIVLSTCMLFGLSLAVVLLGIVPPFTADTSRAVNVVHVVDTTGSVDGNQDPRSYVSLFSFTPGKLTEEAEQINEGFRCGRDKVVDLVTFSAKYSCWTYDDSDSGWSKSDIPTMNVGSDTHGNEGTTRVLLDTKGSTRWTLAINADDIEDFTFKVAGSSEELASLGDMSSVDGWHVIQYSGGQNAPTRFDLALFWLQNSTGLAHHVEGKRDEHAPLLKLRTDMDIVTSKVERVLSKLPPWCSLFGKSTSPNTLAFLSNLPVNF